MTGQLISDCKSVRPPLVGSKFRFASLRGVTFKAMAGRGSRLNLDQPTIQDKVCYSIPIEIRQLGQFRRISVESRIRYR